MSQVTGALLERGEELLLLEQYEKAAGTAFAILIAVESEICHVYDEGSTYQCIISDAFALLKKLVEKSKPTEEITANNSLTIHFFDLREGDDRIYDAEWETFNNAT